MNIIKNILLNFAEILLFLGVFASIYSNFKIIIENKFKIMLLFFLFFLVSYLSISYISKPYHTLVISVFCILILTFITKIRILTCTIIFFIFIIIISITEYITGIIEMIIFNINLNQIILNDKYSTIGIIISKILQIIIVLMLFKFRTYFNRFKLFQKDGSIFSNLIIQLGIFNLLILTINLGFLNHIENSKLYAFITFILFFTFLTVQLLGLKEYKRIIDIESKYKIQENQIKSMEEIIKIIRQEKHDFANHINVIWGLCSLNKPDTIGKIKNYVSGISNILHSSFKYIDTGNDCLSALLSIKNSYAIKKHINFDVMIEEPFSSIDIKENDLISIISNIIDNAFEAFDEDQSSIENKEIAIDSFSEDNKFFIEISNNGAMIPKDIQNKIFQRGFSTKTKKSQDHGFGLYIIKQLIQQNNGKISLESTSERTKFLIELKMKK